MGDRVEKLRTPPKRGSLQRELQKLEDRLDKSERKKMQLKEEKQSVLRATRDIVELERVKREGVERELRKVESELRCLGRDSEEQSRREVQREIRALEEAGLKWGGVQSLLAKAEQMEKQLLLMKVKNDQLKESLDNVDFNASKLQHAEEALEIKKERIQLLGEGERQAKLRVGVLESQCDKEERAKQSLQERLIAKELLLEGAEGQRKIANSKQRQMEGDIEKLLNKIDLLQEDLKDERKVNLMQREKTELVTFELEEEKRKRQVGEAEVEMLIARVETAKRETQMQLNKREIAERVEREALEKADSYQKKYTKEVNRVIEAENRNAKLRIEKEDMEREIDIFRSSYSKEKDRREEFEIREKLALRRETDAKKRVFELKKESKLLEELVVDRTKEKMGLQHDKEKVVEALNNADDRLSSLRKLLISREQRIEDLLVSKETHDSRLSQNKNLRDMGLGLCKIIEDLKGDLNGLKGRNQDLVHILLKKI